MSEDRMIIHFDSDCLMCSRTLRLLAAIDHHDRLRFRPLAVSPDGPPDTLIAETGGRRHEFSEAVVAILVTLGGGWKLIAFLGRLVPRPWRDALYRFIADRRYRWFGKKEACELPSEAVRRRLLPPG